MTSTIKPWFKISFVGPDAQKYLQGQIPVDLTKLPAHKATISASCQAKGKMLAVYKVIKWSEEAIDFLIEGTEQAQAFFTHIKKFAVFSKVEITLEPSPVQAFFCPTQLAILAQAHKTQVPEEEVVKAEASLYAYQGLALVFNDEEHHGLAYPVSADQLAALPPLALPEGHCLVADPTLAGASYLGYFYSFAPEYGEKYLPQAFGLERLEKAISFKKGCYQGQEGIARAKWRGANPHCPAVFLLSLASDDPLVAILEQAGAESKALGAEEAESEEEQTLVASKAPFSLAAQLGEGSSLKATGKIVNVVATNPTFVKALGLAADQAHFIIQAVTLKKVAAQDYPFFIVSGGQNYRLESAYYTDYHKEESPTA